MNTSKLIRTFKHAKKCLPKKAARSRIDSNLHRDIGEIFDPRNRDGHPAHLDISSEEVITPHSALIDPLP